jgi:hypothetical protein
MKIVIETKTGKFAENKDVARDIREEHIIPSIEKGKEVILDFGGVESTTQSFIHALISEPIRKYNGEAMKLMVFKNCNDNTKEIITIVADYMQSAL